VALVDSLLTAIARADGDALVMHVGERPYVVAPAGPVELSSRPLTLEAVSGMLGQLLPDDSRRALDELGAIEHELPPSPVTANEQYTVVAARGGDDIWIEIRRHRRAAPPPPVQAVPVERPAEAAPPAPEIEPVFPEVPEAPPPVAAPPPAPVVVLGEIEEALRAPAEALAAAPPEAPAAPVREAPVELPPQPPVHIPVEAPVEMLKQHPFEMPPAAAPQPEVVTPVAASQPPHPLPRPALRPEEYAARPEPARPAAQLPHDVPPPFAQPLGRAPVRAEIPQRPGVAKVPLPGLDRLLRVTSGRGAPILYLVSQARPSIRVDGEIVPIEGEPVLSAADVEALVLGLAPERDRESLRNGAAAEWTCEVPEVGRVRAVGFRDHRGPGAILRIISARVTPAEQLGLSREIQTLTSESEGLILVVGPRASGKSTLIAAFVDLINRTRSDYVITLEGQIKVAHENRVALISQREVRGEAADLATAARAALGEDPDVLVVEDLRSASAISVVLDAVESGRLVIGSLSAHTAATALGKMIDLFPPERRAQVQLTLAEGLRGIVAQVLLRKSGGGRVAARELLLNTPSVANLIAEGRIAHVPLALDSGRKDGMVPLNDALAAFVQSGAVDVREAYRKAFERQNFLAVLRREGLDTSFVERLA
jgi:twitching motility protein PilT